MIPLTRHIENTQTPKSKEYNGSGQRQRGRGEGVFLFTVYKISDMQDELSSRDLMYIIIPINNNSHILENLSRW